MSRTSIVAVVLALVVAAYSYTDAKVARPFGGDDTRNDAAPAIDVSFFDYDAGYVQTELRGWTVIVNRDLLASQPALTQRALGLLEGKLAEIERTVYRFPLRSLQRVPIWIESDNGNLRGLAYHWSAQWLREHGYNPAKAKAVEIHNVRDFVAWSATQPWLVMHELAHAYHDRALGEENESIVSAFENARRSGVYERVRYHDGSTRRAYAMTNAKEYFAELSEAYHGRNDFFPFDHADLQRHDPQGFALMEQVWRR